MNAQRAAFARWAAQRFSLEQIDGDGLCPVYLWRWVLVRRERACLYLHHFVGNDWSLDLHDHPKRFVSLGLWGSYVEETDRGERRFSAPFLRWFPAEHRHRLRVDGGSCWTLVLVLRHQRGWGFWHQGDFVPWNEYVGSEVAHQRKDC